jgi:hypothetical protein
MDPELVSHGFKLIVARHVWFSPLFLQDKAAIVQAITGQENDRPGQAVDRFTHGAIVPKTAIVCQSAAGS